MPVMAKGREGYLASRNHLAKHVLAPIFLQGALQLVLARLIQLMLCAGIMMITATQHCGAEVEDLTVVAEMQILSWGRLL